MSNNIEKIEYLIKKIVDTPNNSDFYLELANLYTTESEYDLAINVYESLLNIEPLNFVAITNIGSLFFYKNDFNKAINYYSRAVN